MQEQHHDVYDATSRSVQLGDIPSSLREAELGHRIIREDLPVEGARVFVFRKFFTPEECNYFINATEAVGYDKHSDLTAEYPPEYRNNQRLIVISTELGDGVWNRLQPQLQFKDVHNITPIGYATEGLWLPSSVNSGFLFGRYKPGQYFKPHYDGMYKDANSEEVSIYTITVYLNDNYEGGSVKFMRSREDPTVLYTYKPRQGDALIFNHDVYHEGETLATNMKYLARTCLMFKQMSDLSDPNKPWENDPEWLQMRDDFAKFDEILDEKNPKKFAETYLRLQSIQLKHARSIKPDLHSILPLEILVSIFTQMNLQTLNRSFRVCKVWHSLSIHGSIWREIYAKYWGRNAVRTIEGVNSVASPDVVNWQEKFRYRIVATEECQEKMIVFPGEYFYAKKGIKTTQFIGAVHPRLRPWDHSFMGYMINLNGGIRYTVARGDVGGVASPIGYMYNYATQQTSRSTTSNSNNVIVVTNRLSWGALRDPDYVIGLGACQPKTLLTLKSFYIHREFKVDLSRLKSEHKLSNPIDPAITCAVESNAYPVFDSFQYRYVASLSFIDRSLALAFSKSCRNGLVISEEHEYNDMPAQLTLTPVIDYKVVREHEKLVEIYYNTPNDGANVAQLVAIIRELVQQLGGPQKINSKILFSREEETAQKSFLFVLGDKLEFSLKNQGFDVIQTYTKDVLDGAEIFGLSELYHNSVVFKRDLSAKNV